MSGKFRRFGGAVMLTLLAASVAACAPETTATPTPTATATPSATVAPSPTPTPTPQAKSEAAIAVENMSLRDRLASLLILHAPGTDAASLQAFISDIHPGGLIFMGDNVGWSIADVAALTSAIQTPELPLVLAVDEEGGWVTRLPGDDFPAGIDLALAPPADTASAFTNRANLVCDAGLNTNFGIIADVTANPDFFIYPRVLGETPADSARRVAAAVIAEQAAGVESTIKHFPGHGAAAGDSHSSLPTTDVSLADWRATDAIPFEAGIRAGTPLVMIGHLIYSQVDSRPASQSPTWHSILRDDLGFTGLIVSDDLGMLENSGDPTYASRVDNTVRALAAGTTMVVIVVDSPTAVSPTELLDGLEAAVADGLLSEDTVTAAAIQVWNFRNQLTTCL